MHPDTTWPSTPVLKPERKKDTGAGSSSALELEKNGRPDTKQFNSPVLDQEDVPRAESSSPAESEKKADRVKQDSVGDAARDISWKNKGAQDSYKTGKNVTTTFFVPTSKNSLLFKLISERERTISKKMGSTVKILEQAGTPLLNSFIYKFPISEGCPKNETCTLCSNDTVGCSTKGVIYKAYCVDCETDIIGTGDLIERENGPTDTGDLIKGENGRTHKIPTYIGETSRPARERISEHIKNWTGWNKKSIIIHHWMEQHPTQIVSPQFKFEIIGAYNDPLRRQLSEAIHILEQGTLNSKHEFGVNEIYQLQCLGSSRDQESYLREELEKRQCDKIKLQNFIDVMSVACTSNQIIINSRSVKRQTNTISTENKRRKIMNTSTPDLKSCYRSTKLIPEEASPIEELIEGDKDGSQSSSSQQVLTSNTRTNISGQLDITRLTPIKKLTTSVEDLKLVGGARDLSNAKKRSRSLPDLSWDNIENALFYPYETRRRENLEKKKSCSSGQIDNVNYLDWSNKDFTPELNKEKGQVEQESEKNVDVGGVAGRDASSTHSHASPILEKNVSVTQSDASPMLRKAKRNLDISPSTPVGLHRKLKSRDSKEAMNIITFSEDVEMVDAQDAQVITERDQETSTINKMLERRPFMRGLRRSRLESLSSSVSTDTSNVQTLMPTPKDKQPEGMSKITIKGMSIKNLKLRNKKQQANYKTTRKKGESNKGRTMGGQKHNIKGQRLIHQYYTLTPKNNQDIVGLEGGVPGEADEAQDTSSQHGTN